MSEEVIAPGKRLYKPLVHPTNGNVLLPAGTVLTNSYIERIRRQGFEEQLAECLEVPAPGGPGGPAAAKDLDAFEIEIPDLPDILLEFTQPAAPPPPPAAAASAAAAQAAAPKPQAPAPPPAWASNPHGPQAPAAAGVTPPATPGYEGGPPQPGGPGGPGYVPTATAPGWTGGPGAPAAGPAPGPAMPPPPGSVPMPAQAAVPVAPPKPVAPAPRYHHNPQHVLPERSLMGAMLAVDQFDQQIRDGQLPAYDALSRLVQEVIDRLGSNQSQLANGLELRIVNQPHHRSHPVNVFVLSVAMGMALGYNQQQLLTLGIAALCHDIGKTAIPAEVLDKVGPLSQQEIDLLRAHTLMGKRIMEKLPWASPEMARVVYEHHERVDGSGYPLRLIGPQIHEMSKIVAIAEVYDALVSDTAYRPRYAPELCYNTVRHGERMGLDPAVLRAFVRHVFPYPVNTWVLLNNEETGQVVQNNRQDPLRPVVKLTGRTLNLLEHPEHKIVNTLFQAF